MTSATEGTSERCGSSCADGRRAVRARRVPHAALLTASTAGTGPGSPGTVAMTAAGVSDDVCTIDGIVLNWLWVISNCTIPVACTLTTYMMANGC